MDWQDFQIVNLDKREALLIPYGPLEEWLFDRMLDTLLSPLLAIPLDVPVNLGDISAILAHTQSAILGHRSRRYGQFERLPVELLLMIFDAVEELQYKLALTLTCRYLLEIGSKHIRTHINAGVTRWVGDRIIILGSDMLDEDLPAGLLANGKEKVVGEDDDGVDKEERIGDAAGQDDGPADEDGQTRKVENDLYDLATHIFRGIDSVDWLERQVQVPISFVQRLTLGEQFGAKELCRILYVVPGQPAPVWVLCNRTKYEFVRADATAQVTLWQLQGPFAHGGVGLGHVLASLLCWSSMATAYPGDLHRGRWAGDRIEITTTDRLRLPPGNVWRDVSQQALERLAEVWDAEHADEEEDWRGPIEEWWASATW
ncbi:hypothetical protein BKA93DRAFT_752402 [Sparassis latifolia]